MWGPGASFPFLQSIGLNWIPFRIFRSMGWPDPVRRSWILNWTYQKKMTNFHVVDRSVTIPEEPRRKSFEKYRNCCNFRHFWWFYINSGGGRSGRGVKIWTYILFGSISMSETRFLKNIGWSWGLRVIKFKITTPDPRGVCGVPGGCVFESAFRRPRRSRNRRSARKQRRVACENA